MTPRALHVVPSSNAARVCGGGGDALTKATCDALSRVVGDAESPIFIVAADGRDLEALRTLATRGFARLRLADRVVVVAAAAAAATLATELGLGSTVVRVAETETDTENGGGELKLKLKLAMKWRVAAIALSTGRSALLIDPATALLRDPSSYFYRDADIEALSDGWDDTTAYGYDHVVDDPDMDWSRYVHGGRVLSVDPGFAFARPTTESVALAELVASRILGNSKRRGGNSKRHDADADAEHLAFNEAMYLPSHGAYTSPGAMKRTLNYLCFANSKLAFRFLRKDAHFKDRAKHAPVAVRLSYHAREVKRLEAVYDYYLDGDVAGMNAWSDGVGVRSKGEAAEEAEKAARDARLCAAGANAAAASTFTAAEINASAMGVFIAKHSNWSWAGITPFAFETDGRLSTPWGRGTWTLVPAAGNASVSSVSGSASNVATPPDANALVATFAGATHVLHFERENARGQGEGEGGGEAFDMFISTRCGDGDVVVGRAVVADGDAT